MDGYSMIKQMRKLNFKTPIIVITAKEKLKDLIEVEGVDAFIPKPFELKQLESKIREVIDKASHE